MKPFVSPSRLAALFVMLCAALPAAAPAAPQGVLLRLKFTPGQVTRTKVTMDMDYTVSGLPGAAAPTAMKMHMAQVLSRTVQSVAADGAATLLVHQESGETTLSVNGKAQALPADASAPRDVMTLVMTPTGKVVSSQMLGAAGAESPMQGMDMSKMQGMQGRLDFPDAPVNVGDSWKGTAALDKIFGATALSGMTASMAMQSTLTSVSPAGIASINQTLIGTFGGGASPGGHAFQMDGTMSGAGTYSFDTAAGQDAGYTGAYTLNFAITTPQMANPLNMQGQMTIRRDPLPASAK